MADRQAPNETQPGMNTAIEQAAALGMAVKRAGDGEGSDPLLAKVVAQVALQSCVSSGAVVSDYSKWICKPEMGALADQLEAWDGSMKEPEAMLYSQAHACQAIFANLARTAAVQTNHAHWESTLRMALKAQNQSRMTLETLALLKNPPVFARQANINNGGQQQVVNGPVTTDLSRAGAANQTSVQTKQLEASDGERLDFGAPRKAGRADPHLAAVGAIDRSTNGGRKSTGGAKRGRLSGRLVATDPADDSRSERSISQAPRKLSAVRGGIGA